MSKVITLNQINIDFGTMTVNNATSTDLPLSKSVGVKTRSRKVKKHILDKNENSEMLYRYILFRSETNCECSTHKDKYLVFDGTKIVDKPNSTLREVDFVIKKYICRDCYYNRNICESINHKSYKEKDHNLVVRDLYCGDSLKRCLGCWIRKGIVAK